MNSKQDSAKSSILQRIHRLIRWVLYQFEIPFNQLISERFNPFYYLGALTIVTLMLLTGTGLYLFVYYSPSIDNVFESIRYVNDEVFMGGVLRSLHHYASDLLIILIILHMLRMFSHEKYRGYRWIAWVSGVFLLTFTLIEGVTGYIMIWNSRSQFVAINTSKLLAAMQVLGEDIPRGFSSSELMSYWIMWILLALHILIPIAMLGVMYLHVSRINRPKLIPPKEIIIGLSIILLGLAIFAPVSIFKKADFAQMPQIEQVDWFYLFLAPIIEETAPSTIWAGFLLILTFMIGIPWYRGKLAVDTAVVTLEKCTGCAACSKDCPYDAINMQPRSDGRRYKKEPFISLHKCAGCGICIGSCDYTSMDLLELKVEDIKRQVEKHLQKSDSSGFIGIFCQHSVLDTELFNQAKKSLKDEPRLGIISVPCAGVVGKALVNKIYELGAKGIVVAACRINDCHYREGNQWLHDRLNNTRVPKMRLEKNPRPFLALSFSQPEVKKCVTDIKTLINQHQTESSFKLKKLFQPLMAKSSILEAVRFFIAMVVLTTLFGLGAVDPEKHTYGVVKEHGLLRINYFYKSHKMSCERAKPQKEAKVQADTQGGKLDFYALNKAKNEAFRKKNLRSGCSRQRASTSVTVLLDGELLGKKIFTPSGFSSDGLTYIHWEQTLPVGNHKITIKMSEDEAGLLYPQTYQQEFNLQERQILFIDYNRNKQYFFNRNQHSK